MANIWNATLGINNNVKQNTFDWTHVNNLTTQIGRITPIQCELVPAKTSFRAKPISALQLMPMVFPVQTRMRASIAYFRYPLRALWKDYKDFIGNFREGLEEPYHDFNSQSMIDKMLGTGQLMDYLGIPTTFVGAYGSVAPASVNYYNGNRYQLFSVPPLIDLGDVSQSILRLGSTTYDQFKDAPAQNSSSSSLHIDINTEKYPLKPNGNFVFKWSVVPGKTLSPSNLQSKVFIAFYDSANKYVASFLPVVTESTITFSLSSELIGTASHAVLVFTTSGTADKNSSPNVDNSFVNITSASYDSTAGDTVTKLTVNTSPYYNSNSVNREKQIKLSAYAARAYEGIYNSVYRDNRNNPYYIDGVVQYNQWIPTYEGGADTYPYELRYANWEKDFLTTSVQSPQQGNAPLVGITTYEQVSTVTDEQGNPTTTVQTKVAMVDEDGKRYALEFDSDNEELKNVKYVELDNGTTVRSARTLFDLVTSGISITDLRNVNAYQKFLELNMRKSYSYKDIIEGRFDVKVRYADLLLPEFFGGFSRDINMNSISQTVDQTADGEGTYKDVLGSQAGVGYFRGGSDANIECFCDEESIIMGLLVITPLPVYTQLLPKHFLYRGLLDHFNPEFNNISFQPITYKEVCPIQAYNSDPSSLTETFGYQRPWYEYCQRYDQAHGLFRTDLSNFLMHRVFNQKPELAQSFLTIDPDQVTDVFSVTDVSDKVYGQILIECTVKLPVARVAIPRLD